MKVPKISKVWLGSGIIGLPLVALGYYFGSNLADENFQSDLRAGLGLSDETMLGLTTIVAASFFIFLSLLQAILLAAARYSRKLSQATGIEAQFGEGKKGRASLWPLALFHGANGIFILLLLYAALVKLTGSAAIFAVAVGLACGALMIYTAVQLWTLLDELVRRIWVEATALTCGLVLLVTMFVTLGASLNVNIAVTPFQAILGYNLLYMAVYLVLTAIRTPEAFTNPNLNNA